MIRPLSYPFCTLASHCPDSTTHVSAPPPTPPANSPYALSPSPTDGGNTVTASRQAENVTNVIRLTTNVIGASSHRHDMTPPTNPVHSSSRPTGASPTAVVPTAPQDITSPPTLSYPLEGSGRQGLDVDVPSAEPRTTASSHAPTPISAPILTPPLNTLLVSYEAGLASISSLSHFASLSIGSSISTSRPTGSATLPPYVLVDS
jgi:hypothetical protein